MAQNNVIKWFGQSGVVETTNAQEDRVHIIIKARENFKFCQYESYDPSLCILNDVVVAYLNQLPKRDYKLVAYSITPAEINLIIALTALDIKIFSVEDIQAIAVASFSLPKQMEIEDIHWLPRIPDLEGTLLYMRGERERFEHPVDGKNLDDFLN